jgi:hypothetical protein
MDLNQWLQFIFDLLMFGVGFIAGFQIGRFKMLTNIKELLHENEKEK